jgi:hypothetical protein
MLALLIAAALVPAGPECHPNRTWSVAANLDGDRAKELVRAYEGHDCQHTSFSARVTVQDRCAAHASKTFELVHEQSHLRDFRVADVDGWTRRREVFYFAGDKAKIVRFVDRRGACPRPVAIFAVTGASSVDLADLAPRRRGLEVRVVADGKTTLYRYNRVQRRYVRYVAD